MNPTDELGVLGYNSSAPQFLSRDEPKAVDEDQVSTYEKALELLDNREAYYLANDSISLEPQHLKVFSAEQQLAINKKMVFHIRELKAMLISTVNKVKEKQNGRDGY